MNCQKKIVLKLKMGRRVCWVLFPCSVGLDFLLTELFYMSVLAEGEVLIFVWERQSNFCVIEHITPQDTV